MTDYAALLAERFPVRKTAAQRQAFREWLTAELKSLGYKPREEVNGHFKAHNILAGDPEKTAVLFVAHTDTPARWLLPDWWFPRNYSLWGLWQLVHILLLLIPALIVYLAVWQISGQNAQILQFFQPVKDITEAAAPAPAYILKGTGKILPGFQILLLFGVFEIRVVHEEANRRKQLFPLPGELLINPDIATFIVMKMYIPVIHQEGKPLLKHILRIAMQQLEGFRQLLKFFPVLPAADLHILLPVNSLRIFIREDCRIRWDTCFRWMFGKQHTAERVDRTHKAEVDIL